MYLNKCFNIKQLEIWLGLVVDLKYYRPSIRRMYMNLFYLLPFHLVVSSAVLEVGSLHETLTTIMCFHFSSAITALCRYLQISLWHLCSQSIHPLLSYTVTQPFLLSSSAIVRLMHIHNLSFHSFSPSLSLCVVVNQWEEQARCRAIHTRSSLSQHGRLTARCLLSRAHGGDRLDPCNEETPGVAARTKRTVIKHRRLIGWFHFVIGPRTPERLIKVLYDLTPPSAVICKVACFYLGLPKQ